MDILPMNVTSFLLTEKDQESCPNWNCHQDSFSSSRPTLVAIKRFLLSALVRLPKWSPQPLHSWHSRSAWRRVAGKGGENTAFRLGNSESPFRLSTERKTV